MGVSRRPSPEERYLEKKRAELAELEAQLAERELELHTMRGGLIAFEAQYEAVVSAKYALLDEIRVRIAELAPAETPAEMAAPSQPSPPAPAKPRAKSQPQAPGPQRRKPPQKPAAA